MRSGKNSIHHVLLILCVLISLRSLPEREVRAQPPRSSPVARELGENEAAAVLNLTPAYLARLRRGFGGLEAAGAPKEKLDEDKLNLFVQQFGRLKNDMPTFEIAPEKYFVLIPLAELEKQPGGGQGEGANRARAPERKDAEAKAAAVKSKEEKEVIDHRGNQTRVRNQGHRGTCVAFAACAELESILRGADSESSPDLSENLAYYWFMKEEQGEPCKDPGLATFRAAGYLQKHLVGDEKLWEYVGTDPVDLAARGQCDKVNIPPRDLQGKDGVGIDQFLLLPQGSEVIPNGSIDIRDTQKLEEFLNDGHDIVFGTVVAWLNPDATGIIDVRLGPAGHPIFGGGGHAMLIVGYRKLGEGDDSRPFFIVKNSWGPDYGHKGYIYMSYDYIRTYARYGYTTTKLRRGKIDLTK